MQREKKKKCLSTWNAHADTIYLVELKLNLKKWYKLCVAKNEEHVCNYDIILARSALQW